MGLPQIIFQAEHISKHNLYAQGKIADLKDYKIEFRRKGAWQIKYLNYLITHIEDIFSTDTIEIHKTEFDKIHVFKETVCACKIGLKKFCSKYCQNAFSNKLQIILGYNHKKLVKYFLYNGNKACYVCNAQYTIAAQHDYQNNTGGVFGLKKKYFPSKTTHVKQVDSSAKFQLDHYYPRSLYPAFAVSIYNLYPICTQCNQVKSDAVIDIKTLHEDFKFELEERTIIKFYNSGNSNELILHLNNFAENDLIDKFDLKGIYDNHIDYAEELLVRKIKYSDSYKTALMKQHPNITPTFTSIEDRLIVGTYDKSEGIYKRPLSKMLHDLNDQLDDFVK